MANGKVAVKNHKRCPGDIAIAIFFELAEHEVKLENTFSDTAHEDVYSSAANKLKGTAAYLVVGYHDGMSANVSSHYR